jgi:hypothetical protein
LYIGEKTFQLTADDDEYFFVFGTYNAAGTLGNTLLLIDIGSSTLHIILVSWVQVAKALSPILDTLSGIVRFFRLLLLLKAELSISVTA